MIKYSILSILLVALLLVTCNGLQTRRYNDHKSVSDKCCTSQNGKLCGTVIQDCCKEGCQQWIMGSSWCKNKSAFTPNCTTCTKVCKNKGGIPCHVSVDTAKVSCCNAQNCIQVRSNSTGDGSIAKDIAGYVASGVVSSLVAHQLADQFIQKIVGPGNYCKQGTEIDLGDCIQDGFVDLVQTKIKI